MTIIALDIDGTITLEKDTLSKEITAYFKQLFLKGHQICFLTGRTFAFGSKPISKLDFPHFFSAQNGSIILQMPEKKITKKNYMTKLALPVIEQAYEDIKGDFVIYSGFELGDFCYYRKNRFSNDELNYLDGLQKRQEKKWINLTGFENLPIETFPFIRCFGSYEDMEKIQNILSKSNLFELAINKAVFHESYYILQVTDIDASKGKALKFLKEMLGKDKLIIAAGDDRNDIPMLEIADKKIVIETAPDFMKQTADFIAKGPDKLGIIEALDKMIQSCG